MSGRVLSTLMEVAVVQVGGNADDWSEKLSGRSSALRFIFKQPFWALGVVGI